MKIKLTKQSIAALEPKKSAFYAVDEAMPGFAVRVTPAGRKTFEVSTREPGQPKASYKKICSVDEMGIQEAKKVVLSQTFAGSAEQPVSGRTYSAREANCWKPVIPFAAI